MPKGYWIARVDVKDQAAYDEYRRLNAIAFAKFGGRFVVRGGEALNPFGSARKHNVVIEFASHQTALDCYKSPEYQAATQFLKKVGDVDLVIVPGYEGPQPS